MANLFAFTYEEKKRMAAQTAAILEEEIGLKGDAIQAVYLIPEIEDGRLTMEQVKERYDDQVVRILHGLNRIQQSFIRRIRLWRVRTSAISCCRLLKICV